LPGSINLLAVFVSAVAAFAANFVWFTILFRAPYIAGLGKTQEEMNQGPSAMVASTVQILGFLLMAYVLAWLALQTGRTSIGGALTLAFLAWLGFVAAIIVPMHAFQAFSWTFSAITVGGYLLALLIMGAIVGVWR